MERRAALSEGVSEVEENEMRLEQMFED